MLILLFRLNWFEYIVQTKLLWLLVIMNCYCSDCTVTILTHTSNAKCFRDVTLIHIGGFAEIIVPARGYGRHSPNQVMIKRE